MPLLIIDAVAQPVALEIHESVKPKSCDGFLSVSLSATLSSALAPLGSSSESLATGSGSTFRGIRTANAGVALLNEHARAPLLARKRSARTGLRNLRPDHLVRDRRRPK